jgi:hypothetical protein
MDDTYTLIRRAIIERRQVHARFDGRPRKLCPHVLGTRSGEARALFFQFAGFSSRGLSPGGDWRCLPLDRLSEVEIQDGPWRTKAHSQPQSCIDEIDIVAEP